MVSQRLFADHHTGRVGGGVPGQPFELSPHFDQPVHLFVYLVELRQLLVHVQCLVDCHVQLPGDHLGDAVHLAVGHAERPAHVAQHRPRGHGAEGDYLRHMVRAVLLHHIFNDLAPAHIAEVDIDIRHGDALRIEETLKQQVVLDGVNLGDAQAKGRQAACRAAPAGAYDNAVLFGEAHEVPHNQEVICVAHLRNDGQFIV